jgi:hypothetical protein
MSYQLVKTTPINNITAKDQKAISIAYTSALNSDFTTFRLGAVVIQSKVYV